METKRQRLEKAVSGGKPERAPVALWRHFPVDDQNPADLAAATLEFQERFDFDFIKVTPASSFCLKDWGVQDEWRGATEGTRQYTRRVIQSPQDWERLPVLDPYRGHLGAQLQCLEYLQRALHQSADPPPYLQTIFSPLAQAKNLAGGEALLLHLRAYPEALRRGVQTITESTIRFVEACRSRGIGGVFYAVQHASYTLLSPAEYAAFGKPYDLQILQAAQGLELNLLHLHGEAIFFDLFCDYPVQAINWHDRETPPSLAQGKEKFAGAVCGGLRREHTLVLGAPESVRQEAQEALQATGGERFILGAGCVTPITAPRANLLAARRAVEG